MSAIIGERDTLIMNTVPRYAAPIDRALLLTASATMFEVSAAGVPTPSAITLSALMLGAVGEISFSSEPPVPLTVANGSAVLKFEDMSSSIVTVLASTVIDGLTYYARQTLAKQQMLDLRPPPAPAGLAATGHPATISLTWAAPPVNYNNLSHTEVWRATVNDFSKAALVGRADGREFTDPVGAGVFRYYWIRYISRASIPGPYNNSSGTVGASNSEVEHLLGVLTEKLTEDQLASSLSSKIDLIEKLEETYGDTASAAASAAAAALSEAAADKAVGRAGQYEVSSASSAAKAETEAARASSFSGESAQSATNAKGSAAAAENSAIVAAQSANTAGQSAQSAVISSQNASSAANNAKGSAEASAQFLQQAQAILTDPITGLVDKYAAVKVQADATADSVKGVVAKYGVQVDADGVSGGFEVIGGGRQVSFGVRATTFSIAAPLGSSIPSAIPFIVRATETVIGGVTIPIGVYISDAFIQNASITNAKIGGDIWSSNYAAGVSGWYLQRTGDFYANNVRLRGSVAGGGYDSYQWPSVGQSGFYLGPEGLRLGNYGTGKYVQMNANGDIYTPQFQSAGGKATFYGELSGATGTFQLVRSPSRSGPAGNSGAGAGYDLIGAGLYFYDGQNALPYIELGDYL